MISEKVSKFVEESAEFSSIPEETLAKLREMAKAKLHETPTDQDSYLSGLKDGATMTAQFALGELAEESS
jgi:hypothetical protein